MYTHCPLIIDIANTVLTDIDRLRLQHPLVGGLILFGRNWQNRAQLTALCHAVKAIRQDLLINFANILTVYAWLYFKSFHFILFLS